jgi:uncharacterized protein (DUF697 family)
LIQPSPGLRIVLIVSLSLAALITGLLSLVAIFGTVSDSNSGISISGEIVFLVISLILLVVTVVALVGSVIRARWSRWVAIAAGIALVVLANWLVSNNPIGGGDFSDRIVLTLVGIAMVILYTSAFVVSATLGWMLHRRDRASRSA